MRAVHTDTFGGEPNFCWKNEAIVDAETLHGALRLARKEFGLTGVKGDIVANFGDEIHWKPRGTCQILMVSWE